MTDSNNPRTGEWNDSLLGDFLWSNVNTNEALPDVMTPASWSLWQIYFVDTNPVRLPGNILSAATSPGALTSTSAWSSRSTARWVWTCAAGCTLICLAWCIPI